MSRYTPLLVQGLSTVLDREADVYGVGVAGGKGPPRRVAEDAIAAEDREELYFSLTYHGLADKGQIQEISLHNHFAYLV
jgi:hypothetical protein